MRLMRAYDHYHGQLRPSYVRVRVRVRAHALPHAHENVRVRDPRQ